MAQFELETHKFTLGLRFTFIGVAFKSYANLNKAQRNENIHVPKYCKTLT